MKKRIRVILFQEEGEWVAQCLEYDIAAQGSTIDEAQNGWSHTFKGYIALSEENGVEALHGVPEAPNFYKEKFEQAEKFMYKNIMLSSDLIVVKQRIYTK